jgi:hypothetical protein
MDGVQVKPEWRWRMEGMGKIMTRDGLIFQALPELSSQG